MSETDLTIRKTELPSFEQVKSSVQELDQFYKGLMKKNIDYGIIPGTLKPSLYKSGAELLRLRFGFHPTFKIDKGLTNIKEGFIEYDIVCSLEQNDIVVAEGVGNCNSLENKYKYRWLYTWDLPKDFDKDKAFTTYGATKKDKKNRTQYRILNENPSDLANTILKMSKKRAFIDAIITATGASRIFTQDVEDMDLPTTEDGAEPVIEPLDSGDNSVGKPPVGGVCPVHNVPWVEGKWGDYHWTDETRNGKKVACSRRALDNLSENKEEIPAATNSTQKSADAPILAPGEEIKPKAKDDPNFIDFKKTIKNLMDDLGWRQADLTVYLEEHFNCNELKKLTEPQRQPLVDQLAGLFSIK